MSRRILRSASAVSLFAIAACSDAPVGPPSELAPAEGPSAALIGGVITRPAPVTVTLRVTSQGGTPIGQGLGGTTMKFESSTGAAVTVVDNSASDKDARVGYYSVTMSSANWYKATAVVVPEPHSLGGATKTTSAFATPTWAPIGDLMINIEPGLHVELWYKGALALGQSIKVTGPNGFTKAITDGGANDEDHWGNAGPNDGKFNTRLPVTGTYTVCVTSSPHPWYTADCQQVWANQYFIQYSASLSYWKFVALPESW